MGKNSQLKNVSINIEMKSKCIWMIDLYVALQKHVDWMYANVWPEHSETGNRLTVKITNMYSDPNSYG